MSSSTIWSHDGEDRVAIGPESRFDPGVGIERYARALELLRGSGRSVAFASFTFDPEAPGSVVVVPREVEIRRTPEPSSSSYVSGAASVDDGVDEWRAAFGSAMEAISLGEVDKVVIARQMSIHFESDISARAVFDGLRTRPSDYAFSIDGLVGSSPELLASLDSGAVRSVTLAGTATSQDLLDGERLKREHQHTAAAVPSSLRPHLAVEPATRESVVDLGQIKHLATEVTGEAVGGTSVADLLAALHPTPAVGGVPTAVALGLIRRLEARDRGRYGGPVGWFDADGNGEFAIALRCGLIEGSIATLYAGGGLVAGSKIDEELAETELKFRPMLEALGQT